jgi:peptidyl-prolyl cis-trans isomerase A (cyclophilin A)
MKVSAIALVTLLITGCGAVTRGVNDTTRVDVVLETNEGNIEITTYADKAPASARAFLSYVDDGTFTEHGAFYRTVRGSENDHGNPTIDIIQGGWQDAPNSLPKVRHESTLETGLRHRDGTVSLARGRVGSATGAVFFICVGDQPAEDLGGGRDPSGDGQGYAAFGRVTQGMEVVRLIHELRTSSSASNPYMTGQMLDPPVRILKAYRKNP